MIQIYIQKTFLAVEVRMDFTDHMVWIQNYAQTFIAPTVTKSQILEGFPCWSRKSIELPK